MAAEAVAAGEPHHGAIAGLVVRQLGNVGDRNLREGQRALRPIGPETHFRNYEKHRVYRTAEPIDG